MNLISKKLLLLSLLSSPLSAQLYWDGSQSSSNGVVDGGSGTWDAITTNWTSENGNTNSVWNDASRAVFTQTEGTVTMADGFTSSLTEIEFASLVTPGDFYLITATGSGGFDIASDLEIILGNDTMAEIAAPITGNGGLSLSSGAAGGTVFLSGENTYTGDTVVNSNTILSIGSGGTSGSVTSDINLAAPGSELVFDRSDDYTYTGTISSVSGSPVSITGGGNITFTAAHNYNGATLINGGAGLILDSTASLLFGETTTVASTSLLGGTGTANNVIVNSGASIAPGLFDSIGRLHIAGDLQLDAGSFTVIDIAGTTPGTTHDQIEVDSPTTTEVGGTLQVNISDGYTPGDTDTFDFLVSSTAITGSYDQITSNRPLLGFLISDVVGFGTFDNILQLSAFSTALQPRTLSPNAQAIAGAIDGERLGGYTGFNPYLGTWLGLTDSELDSAMLALSPHRMAAILRTNQQLMQADSTRFANRMAMLRRTNSIANNPQQEKPKGPSGPVMSEADRFGAWFEGTGRFADSDDSSFSLESGGAIAGFDYQWSSSLITGLFVAYHDSQTDIDSLGSDIDTESSSLGLYAHYQPQGSAFYYQAMTSFGINNYETSRKLNSGASILSADGDTNGIQYDFNVSLGWEHQLEEWLLSVEAGLRYAVVEADGYAETGAAPFNVNYRDQKAENFQSILTTRISREHQLGDLHMVSEGHLGWRHEFSDQTLTTEGSFVGGVSSPFKLSSPDFGEDSVEIGLGTTLLLSKNSSMALAYDVQLSEDYTSHNLAAMFRYSW